MVRVQKVLVRLVCRVVIDGGIDRDCGKSDGEDSGVHNHQNFGALVDPGKGQQASKGIAR